MKRILEWLENPQADFDEGVALYKQHAHQINYGEYFEKNTGAKPFSMPWNLLKAELMRIDVSAAAANPSAPVPFAYETIKNKIKSMDKVAEKENPFFDPNKLNPEGKAKFKRIQDIGKELASKKAMLDKATTDEERQPLAQVLCDLEDERYELWDAIDSLRVDEIKTEVGNSQDEAIKAVMLYKRIIILRNNIARNEKEAEKVDANRREKLLAKAEEFRTELQASADQFKTITGRDWDDKVE